jgi:integrase
VLFRSRIGFLEAIILKKADTHPAAARNMRKLLKRLFRHAVKVGMIQSNPMDLVGPIRQDKANTGFHAWTEAEIDAYRAHWPLGTKQRLAMELLLWTDQRRGDMVKMGPQHVRGGRIYLRQGKGSKALGIPIAPQLATAIAATPVSGHMAFLVNDYGRPYTPAGFGIRFKQWCTAAGLPHCTAHGLRKAMARRMGELGATNLQIKAVGGWSNDREVAIYTESANQIALADTAIALVSDWEMANPETRLAISQ